MGSPVERWEARHDLAPGEVDGLEDELYRFNARRTGYHDAAGLGFLVHREDGLAGAVAGYTWGGVCELQQVWVREDQRGRGLGRALMEAAASEARQRGCAYVFVSSYDFQAPEFYRRLGFEVVAEVHDKPLGHVEFVLKLALAACDNHGRHSQKAVLGRRHCRR